jgi:hypothetical protein
MILIRFCLFYGQGIDCLCEVIRHVLVSSVSVLLAMTGSGVRVCTDAVLVMNPACVGLTTMVTVADPPLPIAPRSHVTTFPPGGGPSQVPCIEETETKVTLKGSVSLTDTLGVASGPLFVTVRV